MQTSHAQQMLQWCKSYKIQAQAKQNGFELMQEVDMFMTKREGVPISAATKPLGKALFWKFNIHAQIK